jgi:hypothetical protein
VRRPVISRHDESTRPSVSFTNFTLLTNEAKTCRFLALQIGAGHVELQKLVDQLDLELTKLRMPKYHAQPIFHASIAWRLPECDTDLKVLDADFQASLRKEVLPTSALSVKIGQKVFHYS